MQKTKSMRRGGLLTMAGAQWFSRVMYTNRIVNKFIISRTPGDSYSLYVDTELGVADFLKQIEQLYPGRFLGLSLKPNQLMAQGVGSAADPAEEQRAMQALKDYPCIEALILNRLAVYEKGSDNKVQLVYGIEISEYNLSNRMNIPEHIETGVAELNSQWSGQQLTVASALDFGSIKKCQELAQNQPGSELQVSSEEETALNESIQQLVTIKKFDGQAGPYLPQTNQLMKKILALMTVNWGFLFFLTYAKYGWDVGEPVSYLTGLGVDIIAMMGLFEFNSALTTQKEKDKKLIESLVNMRATEALAKWRISYLNRKLIL